MRDPSRVRVTGPLAPFAAGFAAELARWGYTPNSAGQQLQLMAHLSRWLAAEGHDVAMLGSATVEAFLASRRDAGYTNYLSGKALRPLLAHLRGAGAASAPSVPGPQGPLEELLACYRRYLTVERGVGGPTARGYLDAVRPFLAGRLTSDGLGLDLEHLSAADVTAFVVARCPAQSQGSAKLTVTALRSLLGFLHVEGAISRPLQAAVPAVAGWRLAGLPKGLEPDQLRSLLASCDRCSVNGCRDLARSGSLQWPGRGGLNWPHLASVDWLAVMMTYGVRPRPERGA